MNFREKYKNGYRCKAAGHFSNANMTRCDYYKNVGTCFCAYNSIDFTTFTNRCNYVKPSKYAIIQKVYKLLKSVLIQAD